ncbi:protein of unknown function [Yoonia rosea]|uniref:DUF4177 domain-containing protein n=1 Tax=Yoonia rosea TaxID=287098 RepID=A0A1R3WE38_9RHOB|nr:DUF4177 domain-containing protein [Yoonia rosea]SIT75419.1 protein of unknown function [Yoonia rosea]
MTYEYKVVPAPLRGLKAKGVKSAEDRFALALETAMNDLARDGWEYLRADTLPSEQREGLMSKTTVYQNMLVFRRTKEIAKTPRPAPAVSAQAPKPTVQKKIVAPAKPEAEKPSPPPPDVAAQ